MQLDAELLPRRTRRIPLTPIIAHGVRKDVAILAEGRSRDAAADIRVPLEPVLCVLVPEVESSVGTGGAESAVCWVERDGVDGVDAGDITVGGVLLAVALEGEVEAEKGLVFEGMHTEGSG